MFYVVVFGKIVEDKADGVYLSGIYYGGMSNNKPEAEDMARYCIKTIKGGCIVPKIFNSEDGNVLKIMKQAEKKFIEFERRMIEAEDIYTKSNKRKA